MAAARGQALHPYCASLFDESRSTIAVVSVRGEHRFLCNDTFARAFFNEADANKWFLEEEVRPKCWTPSLVSSLQHFHSDG